jgi:hypothetical protein
MFGLPLETSLIFEEAKSSFVYGNYVAAIVLASAFVEHWFSANLDSLGYHTEASKGLAAAIRCARANALVDPFILEKADRLRMIRNPFMHLKSIDHEHIISQRMAKARQFQVWRLLETDAKEALEAMYGVATYAFRHR